jgi:hypothetical protein
MTNTKSSYDLSTEIKAYPRKKKQLRDLHNIRHSSAITHDIEEGPSQPIIQKTLDDNFKEIKVHRLSDTVTTGTNINKTTGILILDDNTLNILKNQNIPTTLSQPIHSQIGITVLRDEKKLDEKKLLLKKWSTRMKGLVWMHTQSYDFFRNVSLGIMIPTIVFSTASGTVNLIQSKETCQESNTFTSQNIISLSLGLISLTSAALSTIYHFMHLGERQAQHMSTAQEFEKLARTITVQSLLSETDERTYINLAEFIKECNETYDQLTDQMPYIPEFIVKKYLKLIQAPDSGIQDIHDLSNSNLNTY